MNNNRQKANAPITIGLIVILSVGLGFLLDHLLSRATPIENAIVGSTMLQ